MKEKDGFKMTYSAQQQEEIQSIRQKYVPQEESKIDQLRALDAGVNRKATTAAIIVGIIGALIMGVGMSLVMTDFGAPLGTAALPVGIGVGVVGLLLLALAYPVFQFTLKKERKKVAPQILQLTDELMK